jgi:hypothetical protein
MNQHSDTVATVREFNRFYTNVIGLLRGKYLDTSVRGSLSSGGGEVFR